MPVIKADQYFDAREMQMVHKMFRREFLLAAGLVRRVAEGDNERAETVASHLEFMANILHAHHNFEDRQIWPVLLDRCPDESIPNVCRTGDQHAAIDAAISEVAESLAAWRLEAAAGSRERLATALDKLLPILLEHMDFEEQHVVPVMEKYITLGEWNQLIQAVAVDLVPVDMPLEFGMIMYEGDPEIVDVAVSNMPEELRPVIRQTAAQSFAEHATRVHGTATPLRSSEIRMGHR
jgi:hemerythrin-like domain-containing protein